MKFILKIAFFVLVCFPFAGSAQEVRPRIAGLGDNEEYMELLRQESVVRQREDSLGRVIARLRDEFRDNPGERSRYGNLILGVEAEIFDARNRTGILVRRIGEIEEAFIIANLDSMAESEAASAAPSASARSSANLVRNSVFRDALPPDDYSALARAQRAEPTMEELVMMFLANYDEIAALVPSYREATEAAVADSLYIRYLELADESARLEGAIDSLWGYIFDNKAFAYSYILETKRLDAESRRLDAAAREARDRIAGQHGNVQSESVATYFTQKELIFKYESELATALRLGDSADSLRRAERRFRSMVREIPLIPFEERILIDYQAIGVKQGAQTTIPEVTVYRRGTIYRVLLDTYSTRQSIATFRGVYPIAYQQLSDGRYAYYAGGYADWDAARAAVASMRQRGWRNARAVVWHDGVTTVLDDRTVANSSGAAMTFRVEIDGKNSAGSSANGSGRGMNGNGFANSENGGAGASLPVPLQAAIRQVAEGKEVSRAGSTFIIGPFATGAAAETAAAALRKSAAAEGFSVRIAPNNP